VKNAAKSLLGLLLYFVLIFGAAFLLGHYVVGQVQVDGPSMNDTLQDSDRLLINKFSYRFRELDRFDIIVFKYAYDTDTDYIKRIIGLPGETVRIDTDGNIYINDELLEESYGKAVMTDPGIAEDGVTLGDDEYFVLGDNRNNSSDSRSPDVGVVSKKQIKGNAWLRISPDFGLIK
jgi:signal peptidase I